MKKISAKEYSKLNEVERCYLNGRLAAAKWRGLARPEQIPGWSSPEEWITHLFLAGRGAGKTRSGSEWILELALTKPGFMAAILAPTFDHALKVCIMGESGILASLPDKSLAKWNDMKKQLVFANGSVITCFSSEHIRQMRGPQFHALWIDEPADLSHGMQCWEIARPAVRLPSKDGSPARIFITGTPRPVPLVLHIDDLRKKDASRYTISQGSTRDNEKNLDSAMVEELRARYEGSRYYLQEIEGQLLTQAEGALWSHETLKLCRVEGKTWKDFVFDEIAIGIDPAVSEEKDADETGIIIGGRCEENVYIIADYSIKASALDWARRLIPITERHEARAWVYEKNLAGPLIKDVLKGVLGELEIPVKLVPVQAKGKKSLRAEPVAALYEAARVFHLDQPQGVPTLERLEAQMTTWDPMDSRSPDRIDALVHLVDYLMLRGRGAKFFRPQGGAVQSGPVIRW